MTDSGGEAFHTNKISHSPAVSPYLAPSEAPSSFFVQSGYWPTPESTRPPSFDGIHELQELAEAAAAEAKANAWREENGFGYAMMPAQGEPARVELPFQLGASFRPYAPDEGAMDTSPWDIALDNEDMATQWRHGLMNQALAWEDAHAEDASNEASLRCALLPKCLAEDVFDQRPRDLGPGWNSATSSFYTGAPGIAPTLGSVQHQAGTCKPCAFANTKGCKDGTACMFCHLCEPGEKKRRKKEKRQFMSRFKRTPDQFLSIVDGRPIERFKRLDARV